VTTAARAQFEDYITPYELDEASIVPGEQVPLLATEDMPEGTATFVGFPRPGGRGTGTRNYVAVIPTTSRTAALARKSAKALHERLGELPDSVDGVVAVDHTEAGGDAGVDPHNIDFVVRVLAGLTVHCNVGAAVVVCRGDEVLTCDRLEAFMRANGYPLDAVPVRFVTLGSAGFVDAVEAVVAAGEPIAREAYACARAERPVADLCVALQCGGSDAFSGVSGNPLAGAVARELVRRGGSAILAETDELIGAESWVLANVKDAGVARRFIDMVALFRERLGWHGQTAEANPSVGNNYRGLYNIALKSLGAGMKKPGDVRLDHVIDYGERLAGRGYAFMNSPGNDIESIAGQVASGCNVIYFTTGNGSITNFPLVPTCKIVTSTGRFSRLATDMDVNAGEYLDGTPMPELAMRLLRLTVEVASGRRTAGERAGHSQVQIWRSWPRASAEGLAEAEAEAPPPGRALTLAAATSTADVPALPSFRGLASSAGGAAADRIGLVLPTSLCSGQITRLVAERLNARLEEERAAEAGAEPASEAAESKTSRPARLCRHVTRFVALPHTEGCGATGPMREYFASMAGHLLHPTVWRAVLLEHGCEKLHNDEMRAAVHAAGRDDADFGWVSVQLDGGIAAVGARIEEWFEAQAEAELAAGGCPSLDGEAAPMASAVVALAADGPVPLPAAELLCGVARAVVLGGGSVVVAEGSSLLETAVFQDMLEGSGRVVSPTAAFGQRVRRTAGRVGHEAAASAAAAEPAPAVDGVWPVVPPGLHIMSAPTSDWAETLTGLCSTGAQVVLAHSRRSVSGHPVVPVFVVASSRSECPDADAVIGEDEAASGPEAALEALAAVLSRTKRTAVDASGNIGWQITRGKMCVSV